MLLTGSVSRGVADDLSDVEMMLLSDELPPVTEIAAALDVFDLGEIPDGRGWWIAATVGGESFEVFGWARARAEERIDGILAAEIVDHTRISTAEGIAHGVALRTSGRITEWKRRLSHYPEPLVEAIVLDAIGDWTEQTPRRPRSAPAGGTART